MGEYSVEDIVYSAHNAVLHSDDASGYIIELEKILNKNNDKLVFNDIMRLYKENKVYVMGMENSGEHYFKKATNARIASHIVLLLGFIGYLYFNEEIQPWFFESTTIAIMSFLALRTNSNFNLKFAEKEYHSIKEAVNWILHDKKEVSSALQRMKKTLEQDIKEYRNEHYSSKTKHL